ncbi:imm11 family protein [Stieleria neptunia]|nr:DUF1629 domain-containing protein [Stieleria neptunia]
MTVYKLDKILDHPLYEGFAFADQETSSFGEDFPEDDFDPVDSDKLSWKPRSLAKDWKPRTVVGRVRPFNDFPCIALSIPAFSGRAVEAIRDLLEENGELLPVDFEGQCYFAYNVTTKLTDALDRKKSKIDWMPGKDATALEVERYAFSPEKLRGQSIFRLAEDPAVILVTDVFAQRVTDHGLNGFDLQPVWPQSTKENRNQKTVSGKLLARESVLFILETKADKPSATERKHLKGLLDELDLNQANAGVDFG